MTQIAEAAPANTRLQEKTLIAGVSLAHFVSHFYMVLVPPLLVFIREDYQVSYTELGLALTLFALVSTIFQTPVGFYVDRTGARRNLIVGLMLGGAAVIAAGLVDSYWFFLGMFALLGLANTVYHPADYSMLAHHVAPERIGQAFSVHTFSGLLGTAVAPPALLILHAYVGWRGAFVAAGIIGFVAAAILSLQRDPPGHHASKPKSEAKPVGWNVLLSTPILLNLVAYTLFAVCMGGLNTYLIAALNVLHNMSIDTGNLALTTLLFCSAGGVLLGGLLLSYTHHHVAIAAGSLLVVAIAVGLVGTVDLGSIAVIVLLSLSGLSIGVMSPSRDMIVRDVTPPGSFGAVFGFVTNGFTLAGMVSPLLFGIFMDHGRPAWIFITVAVASIACIGVTYAAGRYKLNA